MFLSSSVEEKKPCRSAALEGGHMENVLQRSLNHTQSRGRIGMIHTGSCLCGQIRYEIHDELTNLVNCHCSMC